MRTNRWRHRMIILIAVPLLAAACAPERGEDPVPDPPGAKAALAHAQCMRDHGFDWPDPAYVDGEWETHYEGIDLESPKFNKAETECQRVRDQAGPEQGSDDSPQDRARLEEELELHLRFARCMREQGIDFPDPQLDDDVISGPAGPPDGDWESFEAARRACEEALGAPMP